MSDTVEIISNNIDLVIIPTPAYNVVVAAPETKSLEMTVNSVAGPRGIDGTNGTVGATGTQGQQGLPGLNGSQGLQGAQGVPGVPGDAISVASYPVQLAAPVAGDVLTFSNSMWINDKIASDGGNF